MILHQPFFSRLAKTLLRLLLHPAHLLLAVLLGSTLHAGDAKIISVDIESANGKRNFRISVTLEHADEGWDHYANRWDVLNEAGKVIGSRTLAHPHVNEQPFTRSLSITIPAGVKTITILASDSVHGDNLETFQLNVPE